MEKRQATKKAPASGQPWKMPPLIKVYEALGAIADGRVRMLDETHAEVVSSEGDKHYTVVIDGKAIVANDNGSYWQGYIGYPAIAVMIAKGIIAGNRDAAIALAGIPWKELNRRYRNDYAQTIAEVERTVGARNGDPVAIKTACEAIVAALSAYAPIRGARRRPPQ